MSDRRKPAPHLTEDDGREPRMQVTDRRKGALQGAPRAEPPGDEGGEEAPAGNPDAPDPVEPADAAESPAQVSYLDDLMRLQAEFDNYRKRMLKEQTGMAKRAAGRLIERLLPILDNFQAALAHGEGGAGLGLIYKELTGALEAEGLQAIEAEGTRFDPRIHDAVESRESDEVSEPVVAQVYRRGYLLHDKVLRPAMVVVARPLENADSRQAEG